MIDESKKEELHNIDNLEDKIYSRKEKLEDIKIHKVESKLDTMGLPSSWNKDIVDIDLNAPVKNMGMSISVKIFLFSVFILLIAIFYTGWRIFSSSNNVSANNIDMVIDLKSYVAGGEETSVVVDILNKNNVELEDAK